MPTDIEWTDETWNPIGGCSVRSPGCKPCYAMKLAGTRLKHHPLYASTTSSESGRPVFNGHLTELPDDHPAWTWPIRFRGAKNPRLGTGMPSLIFVGDMSDLFHENRPFGPMHKVLDVGTKTKHILQLLTKRPHVMAHVIGDYLEDCRRKRFDFPLRSFWLGMSAERQQEFDERWPYLRELARMGFVVFVSYEPAMGPLELPDDFLALGPRAWVIAGGVSGNWPWAPHPLWFRRLQKQCASAGVPYFLKQWGQWAPYTPVAGGDLGGLGRAGRVKIVHVGGESDVEVHRITGGRSTLPGSRYMERVGKKAAGHLLDGKAYREFPSVKRVAA